MKRSIRRGATAASVLLLVTLSVALTAIVSISVKEDLDPNTNVQTLGAVSKEDPIAASSSASDGIREELDPDLHYESQFFIVDVPPSWKGRWAVREGTEQRDGMYQTAGYSFSFLLDNENQFTLRFAQVSIDSAHSLGADCNNYAAHIYANGMNIEDRHYVIDHLTLLNAKAYDSQSDS